MQQRLSKAAAVAICLLGALNCDRIGGRSIAVDFRNAKGIRGGEAVYFAGLKVGTTGEPKLVSGRAWVPVRIARKHKDALPVGAVFLVTRDPENGRKLALSATVCSEDQPGQAAADVYRGASNRLEFIAICGVERARQFWNEITK